jgi:hypothetical protein
MRDRRWVVEAASGPEEEDKEEAAGDHWQPEHVRRRKTTRPVMGGPYKTLFEFFYQLIIFIILIQVERTIALIHPALLDIYYRRVCSHCFIESDDGGDPAFVNSNLWLLAWSSIIDFIKVGWKGNLAFLWSSVVVDIVCYVVSTQVHPMRCPQTPVAYQLANQQSEAF